MFGSEENQEIAGGIVGGLKIVLTFIGVLTLAIGGVGIMNIMFVNVQERTREIGVRKALGARPREILLQFLLEGLATTFAGGVVGIAVSWGLVWLLSPRPFLAELLDDASRVTDIHLVLSVQLVVDHLDDSDARRSGQRICCRRSRRRGSIRSTRCATSNRSPTRRAPRFNLCQPKRRTPV